VHTVLPRWHQFETSHCAGRLRGKVTLVWIAILNM
jgi:hypothetical protein